MTAEAANTRISAGCPESIAALDLSKPGLLEASAGTGKTYAIEHLVLRLLLEVPDLELPGILVLTFTDKATGELKDKIRARIAGRLAQGDLPREARARLERAHLEFDRASIHTIHGFCQRVLRKYAFENNALFRQDLHKNVGEALAQVLNELMRTAWMPGDAEGGMESFRRLAEALGLGARTKWRKRITDIAKEFNPERGDLLLPDPDPARIAAWEADMIAAFGRAADSAPGLVAGREPTHAFAQRFSAIRFKSDATRKKGLRVIVAALQCCSACRAPAGPADRLAAIRAFFAEVEGINLTGIGRTGYRFLLPSAEEAPDPAWPELETFLAALDAAQGAAARIAAEEAGAAFAPRREAILKLREEFRAWLKDRGLITYDTMIEDVCLALRGRPDRAAMLRRDYRYCLVDEFQDTDPLQWEIFRRVFLEGGPGHPLFLIGDPKQAIYRFRGGDVYTYMEARKSIFALSREGKAQGLGLDTNYRSSAAMVEAYNAAFTHRGWFHAHPVDPADQAWRLPAEPDPLGYVPVKAGALPSQAVHDATDAPKPIILKDFSQGDADGNAVRRRAAHWIAAEIISLMSAPERLRIPDRHGAGIRPLAWGDICVLVRKGKEKDYLERALSEAGIPVQAHRRAGLYQSDAAGQYLAVLESLEDPSDTGRHACALLTRFFRAEGDPPPDRPPETPHPLFEEWIRLAVRRRWQRLFHSLQYNSGLLYRESLRPDAERGIMDFTHIGQNLVQEAIRENHDLSGLVQRLRELRAADPGADEDVDMHREASEGGKVSLMTMHVSKGLEFPVVFLASFSGNPQGATYLKFRSGINTVYHLDAKDPDARRAWQEESDGEDRRLFYVALTRARYKLYIPLLPAGSRRSDPGPLGGFAAEALRTAASLRPDLYHYAPPEDFARPPDPLPAAPSATGAGQPPSGSAGAEPAPDSRTVSAPPDPFAGYPVEDSLAGADFPRRRRRLASYSLLIRRAPGLATETVEGRFDKEEQGAEAVVTSALPEESEVADGPAGSIPGNALPRGKDIGNLFHEILEEIDFAAVAAAASPEALLAHAPSRDRIAQALEEHRVEERWLPGIAAVVWNTLHATLPDPAGGPGFKLAEVAERRPELEFLFPYPAKPGPAGPDGYLWGFVDLVFRKDGRYYLLDWKSNHLEAYGRDEMERSMRESRYDVQYMLYSLALDKWLRALLPDYDPARHFGGVYYLYLRGLRAGSGGSDGIFDVRPGAAELRGEYADALAGILGAAGAAGLTGRVDSSLFLADADAPARKGGS